ncbi:hypothetical protein ACA910_016026 [Epithemia clementina (nom. ined.)]
MVVLDNPCNFENPFQFEITFECLQELEDDLEWKVLYVGSAHDAAKDQVLDEILVGPVPVGINKFVLQADAPSPQQLPPDEIVGVTVVLVTCSYKEREFVRVGYYVNNELLGHDDPDTPPPPYPQLDLSQVQRQILADKPRVTKFPIQWDDSNNSSTNNNNNITNNAGAETNDISMEVSNDENAHHHPFQQTTNAAVGVLGDSAGVEAKMAAAMDTSLRGTLSSQNSNGGAGDNNAMSME